MYAVGVKIDDTPPGIELERTYAMRSALSCKRIARQDDCENCKPG